MKSLKVLTIAAFACWLLSSCKKYDDLTTPDFNVTLPPATYKAGMPVTFNLEGNPDIISFYSGEPLNDYQFLGGRLLNSKVNVSFQTQVLDGAQDNQFSIIASTNFSGVYTINDVKAASWTDITNRFRIASPADNRVLVQSGLVDITDLVVEGKPLYFAFRYIKRPNATFGRYNLWRFQSFLLQSVTDLGSVTLADQGGAGWQIVLDGVWETGRVAVTTSTFTFRGNVAPGLATQEAWGISQPITPVLKTDLGPDRAVAVKGVIESSLQTYIHVYQKPGTYKVTFVAENIDFNDKKPVVKQIDIVIVP